MSETGLAVSVSAVEGVSLTAQAESELYRIVQEALTNIGKHARAKNVTIVLRRRKGAFTVSVADDGVGIAPNGKASGHGLQGMTERAALLGGTLSVARRRGGGTKILTAFPIERIER
jgi:signal transduction histidine kinase